MDHSPPGSSVHGILQARILEWVAIAFSVLSSKKRKMGFPGSPVVKTPHSKCRGLWVRSLIRELRSHVPCDVAKKKKKKEEETSEISLSVHTEERLCEITMRRQLSASQRESSHQKPTWPAP